MNVNQQPPAYTSSSPPKKGAAYGAVDGSQEPLLPRQQDAHVGASSAPSNHWSDQQDDIPEDWLVGVTVSTSSPEIRAQFVRKVYTILFCQIAFSAAVALVMSTDRISFWTHEHSGLMIIPMLGALVAMLLTFWKRRSHPINLVLLGTFTALEAITVGSLISYFDSKIVLQAFVITTFVFLGLTLFTFQTKYDFSSMGNWLYMILLVFFFSGIVGIFIPFSKTTDLVFASIGVLLFSAYIVYDTQLLLKRLHVDDYILASISLYLDVLNLFLSILRILNDTQDR